MCRIHEYICICNVSFSWMLGFKPWPLNSTHWRAHLKLSDISRYQKACCLILDLLFLYLLIKEGRMNLVMRWCNILFELLLKSFKKYTLIDSQHHIMDLRFRSVDQKRMAEMNRFLTELLLYNLKYVLDRTLLARVARWRTTAADPLDLSWDGITWTGPNHWTGVSFLLRDCWRKTCTWNSTSQLYTLTVLSSFY